MAFDRDQFVERLQQIRRPLEFAARQNVRKIAVLQDLEARLLEWLEAATALHPAPELAANLDACRRLFTGFDQADPSTKRQVITTALGRLDHLMGLVDRQLPESPQHPPLPSPSASPTTSPAPVNVLTQSIQFLKGVGPARAQMLRRLGIETIGDALALLPRRYDDRTNLKPIRSLQVGTQETFEGTILVSGSSRTGRGRRLYEMIVGDATGTMRCLWFQFHEAYMRQRYRTGQRVIVTGEVRINPYSGQRKEVHHPDLEHH